MGKNIKTFMKKGLRFENDFSNHNYSAAKAIQQKFLAFSSLLRSKLWAMDIQISVKEKNVSPGCHELIPQSWGSLGQWKACWPCHKH